MPENNDTQHIASSSWAVRIIRVVMSLAVAGIFIGSTTLLLAATLDIARAIWHTVAGSADHESGVLRLAMIEGVDTILVATVLYIIAIGLFQLFVNNTLQLPAWLHTEDVSDLEQRLAGMVVTVISVIFLTQVLESHGDPGLINFGLAIAAVIAAISLFIYVEGLHKRHQEPDEHD